MLDARDTITTPTERIDALLGGLDAWRQQKKQESAATTTITMVGGGRTRRRRVRVRGRGRGRTRRQLAALERRVGRWVRGR